MNKQKMILPIAMALLGSLLILWIVLAPAQPMFVRSFSPLFRALGVGGLSLNNLLSRAMPLDASDEAAWGALYRDQRAEQTPSATENYLNQVMEELSARHGRPELTYRVWVADTPVRNAWALAGGNIIITQGLLDALASQAELAAVLLHELAHIERGHCLALVRSEMLGREHQMLRPLEALDLLLTITMRHQYSKTQEDEADHWAFAALIALKYHPQAMASAFGQLRGEEPARATLQPEKGMFSDWFASHPDIEQRVAIFEALGTAQQRDPPEGGWRIGRDSWTNNSVDEEEAPRLDTKYAAQDN